MEVSGDKCSILGQHAGCLIVSHKRPRSSAMVTRAIPLKDVISASGNDGIGGAEVAFRTPVRLWTITGAIESMQDGVLVVVDEDGERNYINTNVPGQTLEIVAEGEGGGGKKSKKLKKKGKSDDEGKSSKKDKAGKKKKKKKKSKGDDEFED